ncbi:MAG TPA: NAD(P)H-binding protein [Thermoanaerobaculia bacterium]|nr:NAD(P)H-binding protein [Thermoanaerobaculia bacterium]
MKVVLFGASGMVGQGVLRECLLDADVAQVFSIVRKPTGASDAKLREIVHADFFNFTALEPALAGTDACFFTLGVSSAGMSEADYRRVTYDITIAAAKSLLRVAPQCVFIYVSGAGTGGKSMWARVKGETENALLAMPFHGAYMFRPALIQPMHGIRSRTRFYRFFYAMTAPLMPLLRRMPRYVTTTERVGRAMPEVAKHGWPKRILESIDINEVGSHL